MNILIKLLLHLVSIYRKCMLYSCNLIRLLIFFLLFTWIHLICLDLPKSCNQKSDISKWNQSFLIKFFNDRMIRAAQSSLVFLYPYYVFIICVYLFLGTETKLMHKLKTEKLLWTSNTFFLWVSVYILAPVLNSTCF